MRKKRNKNLFAILTDEEWKEANEHSKRVAGLSGITFEDLYGEKTKEKVDALLELSEADEKD